MPGLITALGGRNWRTGDRGSKANIVGTEGFSGLGEELFVKLILRYGTIFSNNHIEPS